MLGQTENDSSDFASWKMWTGAYEHSMISLNSITEHHCPFANPYAFIPRHWCLPFLLPYPRLPLCSNQDRAQEARSSSSSPKPEQLHRTTKGKLIPLRIVDNTSEDDWVRRRTHRRAAISHIKKTTAYANTTLSNTASMRPRTPDASDKEVGKRAWEKSVQKWRKELAAHA